MKRLTILLLLTLSFVLVGAAPQSASALSGSDFRPGRIIDDGVFFNGNGMSTSDIQGFLNSKVPTCETNHAPGYGYNPPFICLKDYQQNIPGRSADAYCSGAVGGGVKTAAQIIKDVSVACSVNPKVLLVLLQKEQSLVTDTWPLPLQYERATGFACPDTAPCDPEFAGFFNQIWYAARQYQRYAKEPNGYNHKAGQVNAVRYHPNAACGSSNVFIENQATAGLYNYTPYQPNNSALHPDSGPTGLYGTGDGCSAYGNRNFWRMFNDWFGSVYSNEHAWRVIRTAGDGRLFLQVGNTKRWIPTGEIYTDWTLDRHVISVLSDTEFNSIPTIPELTRLGNNGQYNYIVEAGRKHYLPPQYEALWGYPNTIAAPVSSLLRTLPENEPLGRFIKDPGGGYWLINGGARHQIDTSDLAAWGYSASSVVGIGNAYLTYIPISNSVSRRIQFSGVSYMVDQGSLIRMPDLTVATAWSQSGYIAMPSLAPSLLGVRGNASFLIKSTTSPHWFMLNNGNKHYVQSGNTALNWAMNNNDLSTISPELFAQFPSSSVNLSSLAKDTSDGKVYVLDGQTHHVVTGALLNTLTLSSANIIDTSHARIERFIEGAAYAKPLIQVKNSPHVFLLDKAKKYHVYTGNLYAAFNTWGGHATLSSSLVNEIPSASEPLTSVFKDSAGSSFLVDGGKKLLIDPSVASAWNPDVQSIFSNDLRDLIPSNPSSVLSQYIKLGSNTFLLDKGVKSKIPDSMLASYLGSSSAQIQSNDTLASSNIQAAYLLRSRDDQKLWFINQGTKKELSFAQQLTLGYLTTSLQPAPISNSYLANLPTSSSFSLLIRKQNSGGIKFLNFGYALGFPDSPTLLNAVGSSNPVILVDEYTYDSFPVRGSLSRVLKDDSGKLYLLENGQRRWMTNWNAYLPYKDIPITYLYGTTLALIPEGTPIN